MTVVFRDRFEVMTLPLVSAAEIEVAQEGSGVQTKPRESQAIVTAIP